MITQFPMSKERLYWTSQFIGWFIYVLLMWILNRLDGKLMNFYFYGNLVTTFVLGVLISHGYRELIIKLNWLRLKIILLIPRVILASAVCGLIYFFIHSLISEVIISGSRPNFKPLEVLQTTLNLSVNFVMWSLLYFLFHFIQNYRKEEIKNLQWQALSTEVELNKLKSQLNPHFIFNSMNSIRALVDENPSKSKDSITQLSNILRSSLLMGRKKVISFSEEIQLVRDYLSLEKTRFEERLKINFKIDERVYNHKIPPMILQTLVENGIKHGISKLEEGGTLSICAENRGSDLYISIENSGKILESGKEEKGFGLLNSRQRLKLLYSDRGSLTIKNTDHNSVLAELIIPEETRVFKINTDLTNKFK
ncbi:MAG: histidine kinase [Vicingaceae bacterium]